MTFDTLVVFSLPMRRDEPGHNQRLFTVEVDPAPATFYAAAKITVPKPNLRAAAKRLRELADAMDVEAL